MFTPVKFETTMKPEGSIYKRVVYWNRFLRVKKETAFLCFCVIIGVILIALQSLWSSITGIIFIFYPIYIIWDFNRSIKSHLSNRDKKESMPCNYTIMDNGILIEIPSEDYITMFKWDEASKMHIKYGFYMFFDKDEMKNMIKIDDIPEESREAVRNLIKEKY